MITLSTGCIEKPTEAFSANATPLPLRSKQLTPQQAREDIELARRAYETIHPGYSRYTDRVMLDLAWDRLLEKADGISDLDLYLELSQLLTLIRCDHTKAEPPREFNVRRMAGPNFFPFRLILDDSAYVFSSMAKYGFIRGDRIISIDGRPFAEVVTRIFDLIPVDGQTDFVKSAQFEDSGDFLGSAFEHFYPLIYGSWNRAMVQVERDGKKIMVEAKPISWEDWRALPWPKTDYRPNFRDNVKLIIDGTVAYLSIGTFVNYRDPIDPDKVYHPIFRRLAREEVRTLILDTRMNSGGSDDAATGLLSYLLPQSKPFFQWKKVRTIDLSPFEQHIKTWDIKSLKPDPATFTFANGWFFLKQETDPISLKPITLRKPRFKGKIIALTSAANASAVTLLLASLQQHANAILVGEPTGGNMEGPTAGMIYFLKLPNSDITARIPWQLQRSSIVNPNIGHGVTPDVVVRPRARDRLSGVDPILKTARFIALNQ